MEYCCRTQTKDGAHLTLRSLTREDAGAVLFLMHGCMSESLNLARYPDEMRLTLSQEEAFILSAQENPNGVLLGALVQGELAGICSALPAASNERYRHRASLGIMIRRAHWGRGIGSALMRALCAAMEETAIEQIELDVVSTNAPAIALYEKYGFVRYGLLQHGMKYRDGSYADLLLMKREMKRR